MDRKGSCVISGVLSRVFIYSLIIVVRPGKIDFAVAQQQTHHSATLGENSTIYLPRTTPFNPTTAPFEWAAGAWGQCGGDQNLTFCGQYRDVFCVYSENVGAGIKTQVPFYFCDGISRPFYYRRCNPCPENCVTGAWSPWSEWSSTCSGATRYRARAVLRAPRYGGRECGVLSESERNLDSQDCRSELTRPSFKWRTGEWTSCRQPSTAGANSCLVGQRLRRVDCVDDIGEIVEDSLCLQTPESEADNTLQTASFQPPSQEICTVPCNCLVSSWTSWGQCSVTCRDPASTGVEGHRARSRRVMRAASNGGLPCPPLQDHEPCRIQNMTACPQYQWYLQDWQQCTLTQNTTANCGAGIETRQVFCMDGGSDILTPVDDSSCLNSASESLFKPVSSRACYVDCPVDCEVGHWSHWSACSQSCGEGAVQMRSREVLVESVFGGQECPARIELRACEDIECAWWHTGRWTSCLLDFGYDDCGPGTRLRAVYCMNALLRRVAASYCEAEPKPAGEGTCRVPCADECVVSEWSAWGQCSSSCGGGDRTRTRRIVAYPFNRDLNPCLPEDELIQTKPCNLHMSCHTYSWQATAWGVCQVNGTASCGAAIGVQRREVACEMETGEVADPLMCDAGSEPALARSCDVPCPTDCELSPWSTWSMCSASCGLHARRTRTKHVLTLPVHGGTPCPPETNQNGIISSYSPCTGIESCYTYQWFSGRWSSCQVVGSSCGRGLLMRDVHCGRSDGMVAEDGLCLQDFTVPRPSPTQRCYIPCGGDCLLSEWSAYGPCQTNCGLDSVRGYCRMRKRDIVGVGLTDNPSQLCPHIADSDLHEFVSCGLQSVWYSWDFGPWTSCTLPPGMKCGNGKQTRAAICLSSDKVQVANLFCESSDPSQAGPMEERACKVQCAIDCAVTQWANWSSCNQACGQGERTRMRLVTTTPVQGGRACPLLTDTQMCFDRSCDQIEWQLSEWDPCLPTNLKTNCGAGTQTRAVTCPGGAGKEGLCRQRQPKPATTQPCNLPCQGECVFSEWSAWTGCSEPCLSGKKSRSRIVIRPNAELQPCTPLKQTVTCSQADCIGTTYRLVTGDWSTCRAIGGDCGRGTRHRTLNCISSNSMISTMDRCQHENITTHQVCSVACPVDCQLGEFTLWSDCSATCGTDGISVRTRRIVTHSSGTGRRCQEVHNLNETRPCNVQPCFTYRWYRGNWSECQFDSKAGCGVGLQTRLVECQRSDGLTVDWEYCYLSAYDGGSLSSWNQLGTSLNRTALDLATSRQCEVWCPGDCVISDWSSFTSCYGSCFNTSLSGQATRTRVVVTPPVLGGKACTTELVGTRMCPSQDARCPEFTWMTGQWDPETRTRDVWCEIRGPVGERQVVEGGCEEAYKPPSALDCEPECTSMGSYCDQGVCRCASGFMGNGNTCYPVIGCVVDSHCPFPHTVCSTDRECVCEPGYSSTSGSLQCVSMETPDSTTIVGLVTDSNDADASPYQGSRGTWKWVAGSVCVGVLILAAILCGALVYRYYHTGEVHFEPIPNSTYYRRSFRSGFKTTKQTEETKC